MKNLMAMAALVGSILLPSAHAANEIKLGFNADISASPSAESGRGALLGIQTAIADINAKGGLLGRQLTLVVRDDLSQPPRSIQNMVDLISNEKVVAVFGPTNSGNALAWKHVPNQAKVPVVVPVASGTDVTKASQGAGGNYIFRDTVVDRLQVSSLLTYAKKDPAIKKIAFFTETTGYGQGGLKDLEEIAALQGLTVVSSQKFGAGDTDMTSQLNKAKADGADTIIVWAQGTPMGHLFRSMEKINYFPRALVGWAALNAGFAEAAGPNLAEKAIFLTSVTVDSSKRSRELYDRLGSKVENVAVFHTIAQGYDAMALVAAAIAQAGSTEGPAVKAALEDLRAPVEGYGKTYRRPFSPENHEAVAPEDLQWVRWKDGKVVPYSDAVTQSLTPKDFKR